MKLPLSHLRTIRRTNILVLTCCALGAGGAAMLVRDEMRIADSNPFSETALSASAHGAAPYPLPLDYPPRALLANALAIAQSLPDAPLSVEQRSLANGAAAEMTRILGQRPDWGEAWAVTAFLWSRREGAWSPSARAALERSYLLSPYLYGSAKWRIAYGFENWEQLTEATRPRLVNEAIWLARIDRAALPAIFDIARASDGYTDFMLGWIRSRQGDADIDALQPTAP